MKCFIIYIHTYLETTLCQTYDLSYVEDRCSFSKTSFLLIANNMILHYLKRVSYFMKGMHASEAKVTYLL